MRCWRSLATSFTPVPPPSRRRSWRANTTTRWRWRVRFARSPSIRNAADVSFWLESMSLQTRRARGRDEA
eukprot:1061608-Prymnesium_polylepis.1